MLHELSITDLGVIESARIEFGPALTCVTGETGAGKTMVLTGLGLILGAKTTPQSVRSGADAAVAEAVLGVPSQGDARDRLADAGVEIDDDGTVVVARFVGAATRSRTVMGGRTVPQGLLADIAGEAVTVHGQSDQARLRSPARQRAMLDAYGGTAHAEVLEQYRAAWRTWTEAAQALNRMEDGAAAERAEVARLRDDLAAIDEVDPSEGEDAALEAQVSVLDNAEAVRTGVMSAHAALAGEDEITAASALDSARRALGDSARHDRALEPLAERLAEYAYGAADVAMELSTYLDRMEMDPARLNALHERRSAIAGLTRRLGVPDLAGVLEYAASARPRVAADDDWDATLAQRREAEATARAALAAAATALTDSRAQAGDHLAGAIDAELAQLAMPDASFGVTLEPTDPGPHGADAVAMTLAAHPGASPRPVADAASGGELSRIMLAIEVSLATVDSSEPRTFVFDEVDAGVGGKAAIAVGNRLAQLARRHQVIVVTHLAQVAAFASTHVVVAKSTDGSVTRAQVREVTGEDRVQEIARLLSGQEESTTARAHALELLEASAVAR